MRASCSSLFVRGHRRSPSHRGHPLDDVRELGQLGLELVAGLNRPGPHISPQAADHVQALVAVLVLDGERAAGGRRTQAPGLVVPFVASVLCDLPAIGHRAVRDVGALRAGHHRLQPMRGAVRGADGDVPFLIAAFVAGIGLQASTVGGAGAPDIDTQIDKIAAAARPVTAAQPGPRRDR